MESLEPRPWLPRKRQAPEPVGVPRRFGMGTLLIITTMYALLFGFLRAVRAEPVVFLIVAGFLTLIGLGQMLLFKGRKPRLASVLVGGAIFCVLDLVRVLLEWARHGFDPSLLVVRLVSWSIFLPLLFPFGGMVGYLAGWLIASVFFMLERLDEARGRRRRPGAHSDTHMADRVEEQETPDH